MRWDDRSNEAFELALIVMVLVSLLILLLMVLLMPVAARAGACLSIDVPPQAVIGQPDGDTLHVFSFIPGGVVKIRVQGVNTPERTEPKFAEAKEFTRDWLKRGVFQVTTCGKPTFDRIEAIVERNGQTLAEALTQAGLAGVASSRIPSP